VGKLTKSEPGCACFAAGTLVLTLQGMVPIESIGMGEQVFPAMSATMLMRRKR
jgi:hypothetical protein